MEKNLEKSLKRYLKRKVKITLGFITAFLITGVVSFGNNDSSIKYEDGLSIKKEEVINEKEKDIYIENTGLSITSEGKLDLTGKDIYIDTKTPSDKKTGVNSGIFIKNNDKTLIENKITGNSLTISNSGENKFADYFGTITDTGIMINPVLLGQSVVYNGKLTVALNNNLTIKNFTTGISSYRAGQKQKPEDTLNTELTITAENINLQNDKLLEKSKGIFFYSGAENKPVNENKGNFESIKNLSIVNFAEGIKIAENGNKLFLGGKDTENITLKINNNENIKKTIGIVTIKNSNSSNNSIDNAPFLKLTGKNLTIENYEKGIYNDGGNININLSNSLSVKNTDINKGDVAIYLNGSQYKEGANIDINSVGNIYLSGYDKGIYSEGIETEETAGNILSLNSEKGFIEISNIKNIGVFGEEKNSNITLSSNFNNIISENIGISSENYGKIQITANEKEKIMVDKEDYSGVNRILGKKIGIASKSNGKTILKGKDTQIISEETAVDISSGGNVLLDTSNSNNILGKIFITGTDSLMTLNGNSSFIESENGIIVKNNGKLQINTLKNRITGDILAENKGQFNADFNGEISSFTGATSLGENNDGIINLGVNNSGKWNNTADSTVSSLNFDKGIIDMSYGKDNQDITIQNMTGAKGTFVMDISGNDINHTNKETDFINIKNADKTQTHFIEIGKNSIDKLLSYNFDNKNPDKAIWFSDSNNNITFEGKEFSSLSNVFAYTPIIDTDIRDTNTSANGTNWYITGLTKKENEVPQTVVDDLSFLYESAISRLELDTLHKRMGEIRNYENAQGVWFRTSAGEMKSDISDSSFKNDYSMLQVGYDKNKSTEKGDWFTGFAVSRRENDIDFRNGNGESENIGLSLYKSFAGKDNTYFDLIGKYTHFDTEYKVYNSNSLMKADYDTWSGTLSAEYGKKYSSEDDKWYLTPHMQLNYTYVNGEDYTTSSKIRVEQDNIDSLIGRIGVYAGKDFEKSSHYLKVAVLKEFMGDYGATIKGTDTSLIKDINGDDTWTEVGIGGNFQIGDSGTTHIYYDIEKTFGSRFETQWQGTLGFRISFDKLSDLFTSPAKVLTTIDSTSLFDFDKSTVKPEGKRMIKNASETINKKNLKGTVVIEGHTDWTGTEEYNQTLSEKRAKAVEEEFKTNITNKNIEYSISGYGETKPVADNSTSSGRALNRRVDIKFNKK